MKLRIASTQSPSWRNGFFKNILQCLSLAVVAGSLSSAFGATINVLAAGFTFSPRVISIQVGDKVIWTGLSGIHSVTGDTPPETLCGGSFPASCTNIFNTPGTYLYHCINHVAFGMTGQVNVAPISLPPTVVITNPLVGTVFTAPASVNIFATATNSGGSVTNVQFFSNGGSLGSVVAAPFNFTTPPLAVGAYALTAKVTASSGLAATSAPVNIFVVTPVTVSIFSPRVTNGQFMFDHTANPGLRYVVENTTNFATWSPLTTNTATSNTVQAADSFQVGGLKFYRVGRLPNP